MIQIENSDTLIDIIEKIESHKENDIILHFPLWHPVLHNYVSLKLLKSKTKTRNLVIITNDHVWKKIGKELGIKYSSIKNQKFVANSSKNTLMKHNFSFWEFFIFQIQSYFQELKSSIHSNQKLYALKKYSHHYKKKYSLRVFFIAFTVCIWLFLFIYYFAVSKSYILITPETVIRKEASNFIFKENIDNNILWNNKEIEIEELEIKIYSSETYTSTQVSQNSTNNAKGKVRMYNTQKEEQELIRDTRLQDDTGKVFLLTSSIVIPPAVTDNFWNISPGIIETTARARVKDAVWEYIWSKWNIKNNTRFFIPGLNEEEQKQVYAESIEDFKWGTDDFTKILSQDDIDNAKELFTEKLKSTALISLKNQITEKNEFNDSDLDILSWWNNSIKYSEANISIDKNAQIWKEIENFNITWSISIKAYLFNKKTIIQRLRTLINEKQLEWIEKISYIDPSSLRMSQLIYIKEWDKYEDNFELKATFEIEALLLHDFLHTKNNYIDYLKSLILWKEKNEAEKILLNDPKISNAKISIRPFFSQTISRIPANILFEVK